MRVAVVSNFFPPEALGGAEVFARDLCDELSRRGFEIEVLTSTNRRERIVREGNTVVRYFHCRPPAGPLLNDILGYNFNPWASGLIHALARAEFDVLHVHNINTTIMLSPLLRALRGPAVCHVHDHWPVCYRGILYDVQNRTQCISERPTCCFSPGRRFVGRWNLRARSKLLSEFKSRIAMFVAPSRHMTETLVARGFCSREQVKTVRLGVNCSAFPPLSRARPRRFSFIGRLVYYKNPGFLVTLAGEAHLPADYQFRIAGKGPEEGNLRASLKDGRLSQVSLLGQLSRSEVAEELRTARALIMPSLIAENSPLVMYEALASGTPVVCSPSGGAKELALESGAGTVIRLDDLETWKQSLSLLADDEQFSIMSDKATAFASRELDITKVGREMAALFDSVTGSYSRGTGSG